MTLMGGQQLCPPPLKSLGLRLDFLGARVRPTEVVVTSRYSVSYIWGGLLFHKVLPP
jgi:hypothetical protein